MLQRQSGSGPMDRVPRAVARLLALWLAVACLPPASGDCSSWPVGKPALFGYQIVAEYPHDPTAFTQGLVYDRKCDAAGGNCEEIFYESTGQYGDSDVRIVSLPTGALRRRTPLADRWFGEGLAKIGSQLMQLTWQGPTGFTYSAADLAPTGSFTTPLRDGWGAAVDGNLLVLSDGSNVLTWVDPARGYVRVKSVAVKAGGRPVANLNELEMVDGQVWANVWYTPCIARICPATGQVTGWILLNGLRENLLARNLPMYGRQIDVLNGIAFDAARRRLFITGKYWPRVFEVTPKLLEDNSYNQQLTQACFRGGMGMGMLGR